MRAGAESGQRRQEGHQIAALSDIAQLEIYHHVCASSRPSRTLLRRCRQSLKTSESARLTACDVRRPRAPDQHCRPTGGLLRLRSRQGHPMMQGAGRGPNQ